MYLYCPWNKQSYIFTNSNDISLQRIHWIQKMGCSWSPVSLTKGNRDESLRFMDKKVDLVISKRALTLQEHRIAEMVGGCSPGLVLTAKR